MKRCPECRRDYYDDTLLYCLEDGNALVQGSVPSPDESATAILSEPGAVATGFPSTNRKPRYFTRRLPGARLDSCADSYYGTDRDIFVQERRRSLGDLWGTLRKSRAFPQMRGEAASRSGRGRGSFCWGICGLSIFWHRLDRRRSIPSP